MRIYITGASGLVGREVVEALDGRHEVVGREHIEVRDADAIGRAIAGARPDWVVHLAACTDVEGAENRREEAHAVNADGTAHVARATRTAGARLLYLSTDYVFDGAKRTPYDEEDATAPISVYGRSKLAGEQVARAVLPDCTTVRSAWLYGRHRRNFVDAILDQVGKARIRVVEDEEGSPTYAPDLARALVALLEAAAEGIVHVVNQGEASRFELARAILRLAGEDADKIVPTTQARLRRLARRPIYSVLSTARYARLVGEPLRHWEAALAEHLALKRTSEATR